MNSNRNIIQDRREPGRSDDTFLFIDAVPEQRLDCIAGLVPLGLRSAENEGPDVRVRNDIADNFLDAIFAVCSVPESAAPPLVPARTRRSISGGISSGSVVRMMITATGE